MTIVTGFVTVVEATEATPRIGTAPDVPLPAETVKLKSGAPSPLKREEDEGFEGTTVVALGIDTSCANEAEMAEAAFAPRGSAFLESSFPETTLPETSLLETSLLKPTPLEL